MEKKQSASTWKTIYPVCLLFAAVFLLLCTKSSPLYPLNEWVDANIYFTIGKVGAERTFAILCDDEQRDEINAFLDAQTIGCE